MLFDFDQYLNLVNLLQRQHPENVEFLEFPRHSRVEAVHKSSYQLTDHSV